MKEEENIFLNKFLYDIHNSKIFQILFVTSGNDENVNSKLNDFFKEDNLKLSDEGFYTNENVMENELNQKSKTF